MFPSPDLLTLHCSFHYNKVSMNQPICSWAEYILCSTAQLLNVYKGAGWLQSLPPPLPQLSQPYSHPSNGPWGRAASQIWLHLCHDVHLLPPHLLCILSFLLRVGRWEEVLHLFMSRAVLALSWRLHRVPLESVLSERVRKREHNLSKIKKHLIFVRRYVLFKWGFI